MIERTRGPGADGSHRATGRPTPDRSRRCRRGGITAVAVVAVMAVLGVGACSGTGDTAATEAAGTSTTFATTTTTSGPILPNDDTDTSADSPDDDGGPGIVPPGCTPATSGNRASMNAELTDVAGRIDEAFVVTTGDATYLGANVYGITGDRIADGAVWVMVNSVWYALSESAQEYSTWPSAARVADGPRIDDPAAIEVLQCTTIATPVG